MGVKHAFYVTSKEHHEDFWGNRSYVKLVGMDCDVVIYREGGSNILKDFIPSSGQNKRFRILVEECDGE